VQDSLIDLKARELLSLEVSHEITRAINRRFHEIFTPGGRIANLVYMAAIYLNPCMFSDYLTQNSFVD
jgi:hypothetical protein